MEEEGGARDAVYANRRRIRGARGLALLRRRSEHLERPNAHLYETGGMRRTHLRGHTNILKRLVVHVGGCNLGSSCGRASAWVRAELAGAARGDLGPRDHHVERVVGRGDHGTSSAAPSSPFTPYPRPEWRAGSGSEEKPFHHGLLG